MSTTVTNHYLQLVQSLNGVVWESDLLRLRFTFLSEQKINLLDYSMEAWMAEGFWSAHLHPGDRDRAVELCDQAIRNRMLIDLEYRMFAAGGQVRWIRDVITVECEGEEPRRLRGVMQDVTEQKLRVQSQIDYIQFLECLDHVNRSIQGITDLDEMIRSVLQVVLEIFNCDRAWLVFPCDPDQPTCQAIWEQSKPEWEVIHHNGVPVPTDSAEAGEDGSVSQVLRLARLSEAPVAFGPGSEHPIPNVLRTKFAVQSQLAVSIYPKRERPYMFGLHQCSQARIWSGHERRLLQEIGRRIADALGAQIVYRQLRDSESRFRVLVDHASDAFFLHAKDGTILDANRQASEALGYTVEELIGMSPSEFDIGLSEYEWARFNVELDAQKTITFESMHRRKDGTSFPAEVSVRPFWQGGVRYSVSLSRDITYRKNAEEALRASERRLDAAQQMAHVAWWERDFETNRASRSQEAYAIFGLPAGDREQFLDWDQQWTECIHPEDRDRTIEAYKSAIEGGPRYDLEYRIALPNGEVRFVHSEADVTFDEMGNALRIFGTMQDITDLRQTERELRTSEAKFRMLVDHAADAFFLMDDRAKVLDVNNQACESLGYRADELIGKHPLDFDPTMSQTIIDEMLVRLDANEILAFETEHQRKDGTTFPVDIRISPFWVSGKRLALALVRNITERKRLEEQFRQAQKMEAVGKLAGGIAHDFNNLLTVINSYAEILSSTLPENHPRRELASEILKAGERAANLTGQLLAFSRKQILQPRIVCLNAVLTDLLRLLRRLIGEYIELVFDAGANLGATLVDPRQFEQAIINLALNARDAMPGGGRITIATENFEQQDSGNSIPPGKYVLVTMSDTGQGMDDATKSRIFEPFFTTKEPGKGTGLGLAMVYGFVKQSNGHIEVVSGDGGGTSMRIYMPRSDALLSNNPTVAHLPASMPGGKETVLLVEDEESVRVLLRNILASCGYHVLEANDGEAGLAIAKQHSRAIDLLVTDLVMPRMCGRQLADAVIEFHPALRILFLSGYAEAAIINHTVRGRVTPLLQKPFSGMQLACKVRELLDSMHPF